jgi:hypothetical protein
MLPKEATSQKTPLPRSPNNGLGIAQMAAEAFLALVGGEETPGRFPGSLPVENRKSIAGASGMPVAGF